MEIKGVLAMGDPSVPTIQPTSEQIALVRQFIEHREQLVVTTVREAIREAIAAKSRNNAIQGICRPGAAGRNKNTQVKSINQNRKISRNGASASGAERVKAYEDKRPLNFTVSREVFITNAGSEDIAKKCVNIPQNATLPENIRLTNIIVYNLVEFSTDIKAEFAAELLQHIDCYRFNSVVNKVLTFISKGEPYPVDPRGYAKCWIYRKNNNYAAASLKYTTEMYIRHAKYVHGDRYDYSQTEYSSSGKVTIICPEHGNFMLTCRHHLQGDECPRCRNNDKKDHQYYVKRVTEKYGGRIVINCNNLYQLPVKISNSGKKTSKREVPMVCTKHNYHFVRDTDGILKDDGGCMRCRGEKLRIIQTRPWEGVVAEFRKIHGGNYNYDQAKFTIMSEKIDIYCKKCKAHFKQTPCHHRLGNGCPICHSSLGETLIRGYLVSNEIKFTPEYRFADPIVRAYRYDFLIEFAGKQALIEFDGGFHFIDHFKKPGSVVEQQRRDRIKTEFARDNDIPLIRIYWEDVMNCAGPDAKTTRMGEILDDFIEQVDSGFSGTLYTGGYPHEHRH